MPKNQPKNQLKGKKVAFNSNHAAIESDFAKIWKYLGVRLTGGNIDHSFHERPKPYPNWDDLEWPEEAKQRIMNNSPEVTREDFGDCDFVQIINPNNFHERISNFSRILPICAYVNGQWVRTQLEHVCSEMNKQFESGQVCNIAVACYSKREEGILRSNVHTELQSRIKHIRFAKDISELAPWLFDESEKRPKRYPFAFTTCHSIHHRGDGCMFPQLRDSVSGFAHILSGRHTEEIPQDQGIGMTEWGDLRWLMRRCGVYVGVPAYPAPIVLNFIEAMGTGAPICFFDNGQGMVEEGIFDDGVGCLTSDVGTARGFIERCLNDEGFRQEQSDKSLARAREFFSFEQQADLWGELYDDLLNHKIQK